jgi:hypothetical protein
MISSDHDALLAWWLWYPGITITVESDYTVRTLWLGGYYIPESITVKLRVSLNRADSKGRTLRERLSRPSKEGMW